MKWILTSIQLDNKLTGDTLKIVSGLNWEIWKDDKLIKIGFTELKEPVYIGHLDFEDTPNEMFLDMIDRQSIIDELQK